MYEVAKKINCEQTKETISDFSKLLDLTNSETNIWPATHLLDGIPVDIQVEEKANHR